jgi:hypothetical protein
MLTHLAGREWLRPSAGCSGGVHERKIANFDEIEVSDLKLERKGLLYLSDKRVCKRSYIKCNSFYRNLLLRSTYPFSTLKSETLKRISILSNSEIQLLEDCWLAIEDSLITSTPEYLFEPYLPVFVEKIWRWFTTSFVNGKKGYLRAIKNWKGLIARFKFMASRSIGPKPLVSRGVPFFDEKGEYSGHPKYSSSFNWLWEILDNGILSKDSGTRFMHFVSTRGYPAPRGIDVFELAKLDHEVIICNKDDLPPQRKMFYRELAKQVGTFCRERAKLVGEDSHLSLSNSASIENGRRRGGRAAFAGKEFTSWLLDVDHKEEQSGFTITGNRYWVKPGVPRYRTMCRSEEQVYNLLESDIPDIQELDYSDFSYTNPVIGLDKSLGELFAQWSYETLIKDGILEGSPFLSSISEPVKLVGFPSIRQSPIGEPGGKVRVITVGEAAVTLFLSPFGHKLLDYLKFHPAATAGISAAAQGYEFAKQFSKPRDDFWFLTSDLTQASEYINKDLALEILKGFVEGIGFADSSYMMISCELLCGSRELVFEDSVEKLSVQTKRGLLMGDPGTKAGLTLLMLLSEEEAYRRYVRGNFDLNDFSNLLQKVPQFDWRLFRCAGDDHAAYGPIEWIKSIQDCIIANGQRLNKDASFISKKCLFFAEELILLTDGYRDSPLPLWDRPYSETVHVDSMKIRLVSPMTKITEIMDDKNPAIGKLLYFVKKFEWFPKSLRLLRDLTLQRVRQRFRSYIDWDCPMTYLPASLGGLGFPDTEGVLERSIMDLPPIILSALQSALSPDCPPEIRRCLALYRTNSTFRGISINDLIANQIRNFFDMSPEKLSENEVRLRLEIPEDKWSIMRSRDKEALAAKAGFVSVHTALEAISRPTYFKEVLTGETTLIQALPEFKTLAEIRQIIYEDYRRLGILPSDSPWVDRLKAVETAFNAASWKIQSETYQRITNPEYEFPTTMVESFKTKSWKKRLSDVEFALFSYNYIGDPHPEGLALWFVDSIRGNRLPSYASKFYIPRSNLKGLADFGVVIRRSRTTTVNV